MKTNINKRPIKPSTKWASACLISAAAVFSALTPANAALDFDYDPHNWLEPEDGPVHFKYNGNPVNPTYPGSDPDAQVYDGVVWVCTSTDGNQNHFNTAHETYADMDGYSFWSSEDMINWTNHGVQFKAADMDMEKWAPVLEKLGTSADKIDPHWMWAPGTFRKADGDGTYTYYLYYPKRIVDASNGINTFIVGVATAPEPQGPYTDQGPVTNSYGNTAGMDPSVLEHEGRYYLYANGPIVAELDPNDLTSLKDVPDAVQPIIYDQTNVLDDMLKEDVSGFHEGTFVAKRNGKFYYTYSNHLHSEYSAFYSIGDSPTGPFTYQGPIIGNNNTACDHHSFIKFKGQYYYFSQRDTRGAFPEWKSYRRCWTIEDMYFNEDGTIALITPTVGPKPARQPGVISDKAPEPLIPHTPRSLYINGGEEEAYVIINTSPGTYNKFYADTVFPLTGTSAVQTTDATITGDEFDELYQIARTGKNFTYRFNLQKDDQTWFDYKVTLNFVEFEKNAAGERVFDVKVNGETKIEGLDIYKEAGANKAHTVSFMAEHPTDTMEMEFIGVKGDALISAITVERVFP